ncbi:MAG: T9SS type A sorting domain-containing protein [Bacteroidia bacterium]|nr:T9SS type A sorting domain-containing protein [Bacteroidia bacterium]
MKKIIALVVFLFSMSADAQITFQRLYYGHNGVFLMTEFNDVTPTSDGGYIACGTVAGTGFNDYIIVKLDIDGQVIWARRLGISNEVETGYKTGEAIGGGYYLLGTIGTNNYNMKINFIRLDTLGNILSNKIYYKGGGGIDSLSLGGSPSVRQKSTGEFIISCSVDHVTGRYYLLIKTDVWGNIIWSTGYGEAISSGYYSTDVEITPDGGYIALGYTPNSGIYIVKTDDGGNVHWAKKYSVSNPAYISAFSISNSSDTSYIISGYFLANNIGSSFLMKIDTSGNFRWAKKYTGPKQMSQIASVQQASDGGIVMVTDMYSTTTDDHPLILKTNSAGMFQWAKYYSLSYNSFVGCFVSVKKTPDDGFIIGTWAFSPTSSNHRGYLIKSDSLGNSGCFETTVTLNDSNIIINETNASYTVSLGTSDTIIFPSQNISVPYTYSCSTATVIGIMEFEMERTDLFLFPNPATNQLTIGSSKFKVQSVGVYDVLGQKRLTLNPSPNGEGLSMDVTSLDAGIYFVKVKGEKEERVAKFVKE